MSNNKYNLKFIKFFKLYESGKSQIEISKLLEVSQKTVGEWVKKTKTLNPITLETLELLNIKLNKISKDPDTPIIDIYNLSTAITMIRKSIFCATETTKKNRTVINKELNK